MTTSRAACERREVILRPLAAEMFIGKVKAKLSKILHS